MLTFAASLRDTCQNIQNRKSSRSRPVRGEQAMRRCCSAVAVVLCALGIGNHAIAAVVIDPCAEIKRFPTATEVIVPDADHQTIQEGICDLMDGGTLYVLPGTYAERIIILGKAVEIRGVGNEDGPQDWPVIQQPVPTEVVAADEAQGVITVAGGASLTLRMLRIIGGDAGLLVQEPSGPVELKHAVLEQNGRGILHFSSGKLSIKHTDFYKQLWNGISYVPGAITPIPPDICGGLEVSHGVLGITERAGIYARGCYISIDHTSINFAKGGGIVALQCGLVVKNVEVNFANYAGILMVDTLADIENNTINFTQAGENDRLGDAFTVWTEASTGLPGTPPSNVYFENNETYFSQRAALSNFGSVVTLKNNLFAYQGFDIGAEGWLGFVEIFNDLGGNECVNLAHPNDTNCLAKSYQLTSPPPFGGLE